MIHSSHKTIDVSDVSGRFDVMCTNCNLADDALVTPCINPLLASLRLTETQCAFAKIIDELKERRDYLRCYPSDIPYSEVWARINEVNQMLDRLGEIKG